MKVWKYYLIPENDEVRQKYELYAFTNNKDFVKIFENQRDMNKFIKGDVVDLDKEDYIEFANDNQDQRLDLYKFETNYVDETGRYTLGIVDKVLATYSEYITANSDSSEDMIFDLPTMEIFPHYRIFNKKLIKSLKTLEFINLYKLLNNNPNMDTADDDYSAPNLTVDELRVFIRLYGRLFK